MDGASKVLLPTSGKEECSETTVEIKIKTLDSQTYTLRVNKFVSVPALKEQIASVTGVLSEQQRLICRGKVLKDDELLSSHHVEDGHTLHLVVRHPIDSSSSSTAGVVGTENVSNLPGSPSLNRGHAGHNVIIGAVNLSGPGYPSAPDLSRIFSSVIGTLGDSRMDVGSVRVGSRLEHGSESHGRREHRDSSDASQTQADQSTAGVEFDQHQETVQATVIPDSLATLSQYMNYIQHQFDALGPRSSSHSDGEGQGQALNTTSNQGLPTPATLAGVALWGRRLLMEQAARCLSELASQLQNQAMISDARARSRSQSYSMRSGALLQNLGSLLLELGRTIMTVRMGQTPDEAVVSAGPAIFISASSPSPLMVQAAIGLSGSGSPHPGHGLAGGLLSRNIDIRIRRGNSVPVIPLNSVVSNTDPSNGQQASGRMDSSRRTVDSIFQRILHGISGTAPSPGVPTIRVVPIRTVIAIPAGVSQPSSEPLVARSQGQFAGSVNDARGSVTSAENAETVHGQHLVSNSAPLGPTSETRNHDTERDGSLLPTHSDNQVPLTSSTNEPAQHRHGDFPPVILSMGGQDGMSSGDSQTNEQQEDGMPFFEMLRRIGICPEEVQATMERMLSNENEVEVNPERQESPRDDNADGSFFSSLVRQLMPFILQGTALQDSNFQSPSSEQPSSSVGHVEEQHSRDTESHNGQPDAPAAKRQKTE